MSVFSAKRLLAASFVCAATAAAAQNGNSVKENDPYSRYGTGEPVSGTNVLNRGMGYTSTAYQSTGAINTDNPASYATFGQGLGRTIYEGGFTGSLRTIRTDGTSYQTGSASLSYLRIGLPVSKHAGIAFGIQPQSHVFYHTIDTASVLRDESAGGGTFLNKNVSEYSGEGGLNYAFLGGGGEYGGFLLGVNFGYIFGNIRNTSRLVNIDSTHVLGTDLSRFTKYGGLYWKIGAQYHDTLSSGLRIRVGATATLSQSINGNREAYSSSFYFIGTTEYADTAYHTTAASGKLVLPATYSFGAQVGGNNWSIAADVIQTDWSSFSNYDVKDSVRDKTIRFNVGGEYTPDPTSVYHYLSRITYRAGFYYGTDYVQLRNVDLNYYGFTLGASFPFKRNNADPYGIAALHTAIEVGRRGTETNGLVQANYFKVHLGISLGTKWFIKRRYE